MHCGFFFRNHSIYKLDVLLLGHFYTFQNFNDPFTPAEKVESCKLWRALRILLGPWWLDCIVSLLSRHKWRVSKSSSHVVFHSPSTSTAASWVGTSGVSPSTGAWVRARSGPKHVHPKRGERTEIRPHPAQPPPPDTHWLSLPLSAQTASTPLIHSTATALRREDF